MVFLRAFLLWGLVSVHIVGAAFLFRRLFPRESRWLAFIVPEIVAILACNFVEHHVALTHLRIVLPVTTVGSIVLMAQPKAPWRIMRFPAILFMVAFAFSLAVRALHPDIVDSRDGIYDLGIISDFMFGETLPVEATWLPPVKLIYYYCLEHYAASVFIRLLGVDISTGLNLCVSLLTAYILFLSGAVAWHLSRGKLWIAIAAPVLTACAANGMSGYLWLAFKDVVPLNITDPSARQEDSKLPDSGLLHEIAPIDFSISRELFPPGIGSWTGYFHSTNTGQLICCLVVLSIVELFRRKKADWPWICLALSPWLMLTTCTWGVPMVGAILIVGLIVCIRRKIVPQNLLFVLAASGGLGVLLEPMLSYFLRSPSPGLAWVPADQHTPLVEFLAQWWPVYLPWFALCLIWQRLSVATRIVLVLVPLAFAAVELVNIGYRADMTGKSWGLIYAAGWVVFLPEVARQKAWWCRALLVLIAINCALSLCFWSTYYARTANTAEIGHLEGLGDFRFDRRKARILETLSRLDNQTVIPGRVLGQLNISSFLVELTHNRAYVTWEMISDYVFYPNGINEAGRRFADVDALYNGTLANPIYFLRQRNISAVVIYPDDNIEPSVVEKLKKDLAPYYTFENANFRSVDDIQHDVSTARPYAGVFVFHPEIESLIGPSQKE